MSRQSEAKAAQGYDQKPEPRTRTCASCGHFASEMLPASWMHESDVRRSDPAWFREKNLRCGLGGFAIKKSATCDKFSEPVTT